MPLLVWWPGRISAGTLVEAPVQTIDVLPTLLELTLQVRLARRRPARLYDLTSDPGELRDLLDDRPEVVAELRALAARLGVDAQPAPIAATDVAPEIRERLREIGYVEEAAEGAPED